ncbi:PAS domain S-box protein [Starkeya sp. ORNL1]|uniref:hybrid sensor histidine kinase/response regulator n=1 Tax=Starkeya sp. ORNL1 TaxID=2709380 RepID=UPI00146367AF|nr:PAS domain-containing sensor histidine kinase [Starkeya sp. ORNL1]QJP16133.1 PAS domain S-box protein [Starkeya sp. ORNL1]
MAAQQADVLGQEAFQHEESRYRLLVDAITDYAVYMLSPAGIVTSWNKGAERFKGYEAAEILGEHFSRFYTDEDRAAGVPQRALATAANEGRFEAEGWRVRKDGARFWANVIIDPIIGPHGELIGFAKVTRDLTERRRAEEELRRSEEQFRLLVQGVTDYAIFMLNPDGIVANWNAGAQRIKGYAAREIVGQHFSRFYTEEDRAKGEPQRSLAIAATEGRFEREGVRVRKDGTTFIAHVIIDAIRDEAGELLGFAKVTRDVTEKVETQRSLEVAREALVQSQKLEAIGQLTGGIAHDFNNLLMAILGSLELTRRRLPQDSSVLPLIENAEHAAQRGAALTQRMLMFARGQEMERQPTDLLELVHGMTDLLRRSIGPRITVRTEFPLALPKADTDPNHLESALLNLALNARDAMPDGGTIRISGHSQRVREDDRRNLAAGDYVCVTVTDTGTGMDEKTLARAVEPFFSTKGPGKGTGLGLSMVHGLAEQSGGRLMLKSKFGEGTSAEIWLRTARHEVELDGAQVDGQPWVPNSQPKMNVIAVDDDMLVLMNTVAMLEELGHNVFSAMSGPQALDILRRERSIDVIVTDQAMPRMTGTELARAARAEKDDIRILMTTGYADIAGMEKGVALINKPFSLRELQKAVNDLHVG